MTDYNATNCLARGFLFSILEIYIMVFKYNVTGRNIILRHNYRSQSVCVGVFVTPDTYHTF